ncbi:MAG: ATP-binding protein [Bradymonadales bacterium]|nr:ATP-binding protein [Bradymonadales bacterium]
MATNRRQQDGKRRPGVARRGRSRTAGAGCGTQAHPDGVSDQLALWTSRLLVETGAYRKIESYGWKEQILQAIGLAELNAEEEIQAEPFRELLLTRAAALESAGIERDGELFENVERFGRLCDLNPSERELLAFGVMANTNPVIEECLRDHWIGSTRQLYTLLARVLGLDSGEVADALRSSAFLPRTGLLRIRMSMERNFLCPLAVMEILVDLLSSPHDNQDAMLSCFYRPIKPGALTRADFSHVESELALLVPYLDRAVEQRVVGVNILVYGQPGLGKTELARVLAAEAKLSPFEVAIEDPDGDPLPRRHRIAAYQVCQRLLVKQPRPILLFDEIEDVLPAPSLLDILADHPHPIDHKGWLNRLLEENPVPTVWISNRVSHIDPAILRRFHYVLRMVPPPRDARRAMIEKHLAGLSVAASCKEAMAANDHIRPADIEQAARVVRVIGSQDPEQTRLQLGQVIQSALSVRRQSPSCAGERSGGLPYDLSLLNTDCDLDRLMSALKPSSQASICLYGPSGTGKTAFAGHLASTIGKELLAMRASDLLSKYVGENEKNIADMFRQARQAKAALLLDEADSFLADRRNAEKRWEISQVNELLVQMEQFEGLFLCSTNLVEHLDAAVFRRFDLKIRFDYLRPDRRRLLFERTAASLGIPTERTQDREMSARLDRLDNLTPGDFAAVLRKARLLDERWKPGDLLAALAEECGLKPGRAHAIGFG